MHRLQIALLSLAFGVITPGCHSARGSDYLTSMYYLDGVDRKDGMSASIDLTTKSMRVAGDGFLLRPCGEQDSSSRCIVSSYFVFVISDTPNREWAEQGATFSLTGTCSLPLGHGDFQVSVVSSSQKHGTFRFYVGPDEQLLGWTLTHADGTDNFLKRGFDIGSCMTQRVRAQRGDELLE